MNQYDACATSCYSGLEFSMDVLSVTTTGFTLDFFSYGTQLYAFLQLGYVIIDINSPYQSPSLFMVKNFSTGQLCSSDFYTDLVFNSTLSLPSFVAIASFDNKVYGSA